MSKKQPESSSDLPDDFFDSDKRSKKVQEDNLAKELEQFEREMAALQAEADEQLKEEFDKLQEEKNIDELDQQINQWKRIIELEKKAEELKNRPISENPKKKFKVDSSENRSPSTSGNEPTDDDYNDLDDIEHFEDKLLDWRSKGI